MILELNQAHMRVEFGYAHIDLVFGRFTHLGIKCYRCSCVSAIEVDLQMIQAGHQLLQADRPSWNGKHLATSWSYHETWWLVIQLMACLHKQMTSSGQLKPNCRVPKHNQLFSSRQLQKVNVCAFGHSQNLEQLTNQNMFFLFGCILLGPLWPGCTVCLQTGPIIERTRGRESLNYENLLTNRHFVSWLFLLYTLHI